jgi:hypothetical protein
MKKEKDVDRVMRRARTLLKHKLKGLKTEKKNHL